MIFLPDEPTAFKLGVMGWTFGAWTDLAAVLEGVFLISLIPIALRAALKRRQRHSREIDRLPRVAIRDASEHKRVKIVGKVRILGAPMKAPLSERPCAFYDARVDDHTQAPSVPLLRETDGQDFVVEDETGKALVRVKSAQMIVKLDAHYQSEGAQVTSHQGALLRRHELVAHGRLGYSEGTLTPGETVAVVGTPYREPDPDPQTGAPFREIPMRLVFVGSDRDALYITDDLPPSRRR